MTETIKNFALYKGYGVATAILVLIIGGMVIGWALTQCRKAMDHSDRFDELLKSLCMSVLHKVLWIMVLMVALRQLGVDMAPFITGLGVSGFILGFAFKDALGNLAAGVMISINRPFRIGDLIETAGQLGVVTALDLMATSMKTGDNKKIIIPNNSIWGGAITNHSANDTRRVDMVVGIAYGANINQAKETISETLKTIAPILSAPAPVIEVVQMADSSVNLVVRPWCKTPDYWAVHFEAHQKLKEALDKAGIEIPFPQLDVHTAA